MIFFDLTPSPTEIGVGGVFVLLLLDKVATIIKGRKNGNGKPTAGEMDPSYWHREFDGVRSAITISNEIQERQVEILEGVQSSLRELVFLHKKKGD